MPLVKAEGLVVRSMNMGETSKLVTLFTREKGKLAVLAGTLIRTDDSTEVANAEASFMIVDPGQALAAGGDSKMPIS